jgi:AraC-like DNA-binding protein
MASPSSTRTNGAASAYGELVRRGLNLLREDPHRPAGRLGEALHTSQRTLNRAFQMHLGMTVQEAQKRLRLDAAAAALLDGRGVFEAARRAGYSHSRHLAGPFRQQFGILPIEMKQVGGAVRYLRWQAQQPAPYRGSFRARPRARRWRAERATLRNAYARMPDCAARRRVQRALDLKLKRLVEPPHPVTEYDVFAQFEDLLKGLQWGLGDDQRVRAS